jgi:oxygen-independent coproporphyrinogen-3 oxidase
MDVQRVVHRVQSERQTREVITAARKSGFRSVNIDMIYGLPKHRRRQLRDTLNA